MSDVQEDLDDLKWIAELKKHITYFEGRYHLRMQEKDYKAADWIEGFIKLLRQDLKRCEDGILTADSGGSVPPAQHGGNKTIFILKK